MQLRTAILDRYAFMLMICEPNEVLPTDVARLLWGEVQSHLPRRETVADIISITLHVVTNEGDSAFRDKPCGTITLDETLDGVEFQLEIQRRIQD